MAIGRAYRIKKNAVKAYGYTRPPSSRAHRRNGPRFAANGGVTHIAAINGRGSYRSARRTMSGLSANRRPAAARSSLSDAKKRAFAKRMRAAKGKGQSLHKNARRVKRASSGYVVRRMRRNEVRHASLVLASPSQERRWERAASRHRDPWGASATRARSKSKPKKKKKAKAPTSRRRAKAPKKVTRKSTMARRKVRRKKSARRSAPRKRVAKRRTVKRRRRVAKKTAAPKRKRRRAKKTVLKANRRRRRLRRNKGTSIGAKRGWRTRKKRYAPTSFSKKKRRKSRRKASAVAPKRKRRRSSKKRRAGGKRRKLSRKKSAVAARRRRRAVAKLRPNRRRLSSNRRRRSRARLSPNKRRSRRRMSSNRRRHRRNGRRMFRKNGIGDTLIFIGKTGGIALLGFVGHKVLTNLLVNNVMGKIFGAPATVVQTSPTTAAVVAPATSGLGLINLDPAYQKLIGAGLVAGLGVFASAKLIKDPGTRNTVMTGIAVSFATSLLTAALMKFAPTHVDMLAGDGTAARLSAMYGLGAGTSLQPRYQSIGRGMGEYFSSGVNGLGEYFSSGVNGLGEYFSSGVNGLGSLPAYEAAAGYGANPDFAEAAAGMGAREATNTNHVDPHGDLDRELTIAEAAAGVGALPSYEAAAGFGDVSTLPTSSTWIPGSSNGQIWAGTRSISAPQSATEMVPAGILQTDGGQGVFG